MFCCRLADDFLLNLTSPTLSSDSRQILFFPKSFPLGLEERLRTRIKRHGGRETEETGTGRKKLALEGSTGGTEERRGPRDMTGRGRWVMNRRTGVGRRAERGRRRNGR